MSITPHLGKLPSNQHPATRTQPPNQKHTSKNEREGGGKGENLLSSDEDLKCGDELGERDRFISLPVLGCLDVVEEDDKIVFFALVVAFYLGCFAAGHDCLCSVDCLVGGKRLRIED